VVVVVLTFLGPLARDVETGRIQLESDQDPTRDSVSDGPRGSSPAFRWVNVAVWRGKAKECKTRQRNLPDTSDGRDRFLSSSLGRRGEMLSKIEPRNARTKDG
jgi:hypothetical protein